MKSQNVALLKLGGLSAEVSLNLIVHSVPIHPSLFLYQYQYCSLSWSELIFRDHNYAFLQLCLAVLSRVKFQDFVE